MQKEVNKANHHSTPGKGANYYFNMTYLKSKNVYVLLRYSYTRLIGESRLDPRSQGQVNSLTII